MENSERPFLLPADQKTYAAALHEMRKPLFLKTPKYAEQMWRADTNGAHPAIIGFTDAMVKRMRDLQVPVFAHCIVRSPDEQDALFVQGRSKVDGKGDYPHRFAAVDIIHGVLGWNLSRKSWDMIGHIGKEVAAKLSIPIRWGGDWEFYDPAHWELAHWRTMKPEAPHFYNPAGKLIEWKEGG